MVPCFALMASIGLWVERDFASDIETQDLAQRAGSRPDKIFTHKKARFRELLLCLVPEAGLEPARF